MFVAKGRDRRERTFIGTQCAACEEPLEHTLRGERILQLSCGHVSHEACFYEYIKEFEAQNCPTCNAPLGLDTSRGGTIDFVNLNKLVRSAQSPDFSDRLRDQATTSPPWDQPAADYASQHHSIAPQPALRDHLLPQQTRANGAPHDQQSRGHARQQSTDTGNISATDHTDTYAASGRRTASDTETLASTRRQPSKNPIPSPTVTVRSEFPTLTRSRQQQSLTCLVTVEVVDKTWQPDLDDLRTPPPLPPLPEDISEPTKPLLNAAMSPTSQRPVDSVHEERGALETVKEELSKRCENWHGLDFQRFGRLILHGTMRVSKDQKAWQDLECYLFTEMLICVKARKSTPNASQQWHAVEELKPVSKVTLKGSILIKKHLKQVELVPDTEILTLSLSVPELPHFYLQFNEHQQLISWRRTLLNINQPILPSPQAAEFDHDTSTDEDDDAAKSYSADQRGTSVVSSSYGGPRSAVTAPTEYTNSRIGGQEMRLSASTIHVPLDVVVVIPLSSSMQGLKLNVLRDSLHFLVSNLGERDRMGLVTFGSGYSGVPLVGMTSKTWSGWASVLESIRPVGQKNIRADAVDGANVAMDLLMQRKSANTLSNIILISDSATAEHESIDFVVSRAEAAKVAIHSFGLGLTHKPDTLVELSTKTKACYTYVKDWMMLRECLAGCMGALQSTSHQNVKLKLRLPEGSPAKFVKISGALQVTKRATGRDAEVSLGDLRFGDKRDILVQLAILPDASTPEATPNDPWDNIISGLEALGGPFEQEEARAMSVEELPLLQADLSWNDLLRDVQLTHLPRPSLLAITMLPGLGKRNTLGPLGTPPIPPHPSIVQRRMELLTSDMLSRAITLVTRGSAERAHHLLAETRSILKGLNKGSLPPLPPPPPPLSALPPTPKSSSDPINPSTAAKIPLPSPATENGRRTPSPPRSDPISPFAPAAGIDNTTMTALDAELEASLEWISHPAVFGRDSRKAVLQAIGVISSQRAYTFRTAVESLCAGRISGIKRLSERSRDWRETGDELLMEE
ncbi:Pleckstrin homology domain-containing protein [Neohortaea acidophila]|uniref:Pleckstrin homology domain-containing protein n=1 Tax=Neohortaea acidophila TaxID=245834 RepID=A0A6A6PNT2_9PEZI|nr:Pleckstrin homology domain-containing protein [Neohortaea acidophila]KAF2481770.1 Pleckstrin homology domain-containing protein [Neohortaea acidophila]